MAVQAKQRLETANVSPAGGAASMQPHSFPTYYLLTFYSHNIHIVLSVDLQ